jgi:hypothetical protein
VFRRALASPPGNPAVASAATRLLVDRKKKSGKVSFTTMSEVRKHLEPHVGEFKLTFALALAKSGAAFL